MTAPSGRAWVVGTFDTKSEELLYIARLIRAQGVQVLTVDVGTRSDSSAADMGAGEVARWHPGGAQAVLGGSDRGASVVAMGQALCERVRAAVEKDEIAGMIGIGGSGGTSMIAPAMRLLPIGKPKLMVSTLAAGDVSPFVDVVDMMMLYPVTDIAGLNRLSRTILANAAHAMAGMLRTPAPQALPQDKPAVGCTMFGVTTPCVQQVRAALPAVDLQVFHANGPGGRAMEALAASGLLEAVVDVTLTEVVQHIVGGVCDAGPGRLDAAARFHLPWVGSLGALDMVNWFAPDTIPQQHRRRLFHAHNANVTLMRTTPHEMAQAGTRIARQLNRSQGPVRLLMPLGGVSTLDAPGQPFHDPEANAALFDAITRDFQRSDTHRMLALPLHINDPAFAAALAAELTDVLTAVALLPKS